MQSHVSVHQKKTLGGGVKLCLGEETVCLVVAEVEGLEDESPLPSGIAYPFN